MEVDGKSTRTSPKYEADRLQRDQKSHMGRYCCRCSGSGRYSVWCGDGSGWQNNRSSIGCSCCWGDWSWYSRAAKSVVIISTRESGGVVTAYGETV